MREQAISFAYLVASILFILCLRGLSSPESGRRGILMGEAGMLIAVVATLLKKEIVSFVLKMRNEAALESKADAGIRGHFLSVAKFRAWIRAETSVLRKLGQPAP